MVCVLTSARGTNGGESGKSGRENIPRRFLHQLESLHRNPVLKYGLLPVLLINSC